MIRKVTPNPSLGTRTLGLLVFLLLVFELMPTHAQTQDPAQTHNPTAKADRDRGDKLEDRADYTGAMRAYQAAYALDKGSASQQQDAGNDLRKIGNVDSDLGQNDAALDCYRQALKIARQVQDKSGEADALGDLGNLYDSLNQPKQALAYDRQALRLYQQLHDRKAQAEALNNMGKTEVGTGQYHSAIPDLQQALRVSQQIKDRMLQAGALINLGDAYAGLGQGDQGIRDFQQALSLCQQVGFIDGQAKALSDLGSAYRSLGHYETAAGFYRKALPLLQQAKDLSEQATVLNLLGTVDNYLSRDADAVTDCQQALSLYQQLKDRNGQVAALFNLAVAYQGVHQDDAAIQTCQQALSLYQKLKDQDGQARTFLILGISYDGLNRYDTALSYFQQALPILQQGHDRAAQADVLLHLGIVYSERDAYPTAIGYYQQVLSLSQQTKDQHEQAKALGNLGEVYSQLSQYDTAIQYCQQALPLFQKAEDQDGEANTLDCLGAVNMYLGRYDAAIRYCQQALTLYQQISDQGGQASALNNLGSVSSYLDQYENTIQYCQQALPLFQQAHEAKGEAEVLMNLGVASEGLHQNDTALDDYQQALTLSQKLQDRDGQLQEFINLGNVCCDLNQYDTAIEYYRQALVFSQQIQDQDSEAGTLGALGSAFFNLRQFDTALDYYKQSLVIATQIKDRAGEASDLSNLMQVWAQQSRPRLAIFYGKQAVSIYQSIRQDIQGMDKQTQKDYLKDKEPTYRQLVELLIQQGRIPEAEQVLNLLKDQEFFDFVQRDAQIAPEAGQPSMSATEAPWKTRYAAIADRITAIGQTKQSLLTRQQQASAGEITLTAEEKTELQKNLTQADADLTVANQAFQDFLTQIAAEFKDAPQLAQDKVQTISDAAAFSETLQQLGPGTVALYTIVESDKVRILVVTSQTQIAREYPIKSTDLRDKVAAFRAVLQDPTRDPRPLAHELYTILIGPVEKDLAGAKATTLMWSLDDVLRYVPMAALYDGKQYLVERYRNEVFTPASESRLTETPQAQWNGLGLGVSQPYPGFQALTGVPQELDDVIHDPTITASQTGTLPGTILLNTAFTQQAMVQALEEQKYPLVHIASHFDFEPGDETASFLLLGDGNHLSLADIKALPRIFQGVDLLTLSACDTATGTAGTDGHEVEGFGVLAQRQGAKAVIASLWPVADASTPLLMETFYRQHAAVPGQPKAEALRQAQLALLHGTVSAPATGTQRAQIVPGKADKSVVDAPVFTPDPKAPFAHPYYWAPFILIGNWK